MVDTGHDCGFFCLFPVSLEMGRTVSTWERGALCAGDVARRRRYLCVAHAHVPMTICLAAGTLECGSAWEPPPDETPWGVHRHLCRSYMPDWIPARFVWFVWFV